MQPVLAVYAGYSLAQEHVDPGPDLEPYVQDALDEIEYVTGGAIPSGARSAPRTGIRRRSADYVEIGNEDWFDRSGATTAVCAVLQGDQGEVSGAAVDCDHAV
jgi:alpha-L-arabinofuranosidase